MSFRDLKPGDRIGQWEIVGPPVAIEREDGYHCPVCGGRCSMFGHKDCRTCSNCGDEFAEYREQFERVLCAGCYADECDEADADRQLHAERDEGKR